MSTRSAVIRQRRKGNRNCIPGLSPSSAVRALASSIRSSVQSLFLSARAMRYAPREPARRAGTRVPRIRAYSDFIACVSAARSCRGGLYRYAYTIYMRVSLAPCAFLPLCFFVSLSLRRPFSAVRCHDKENEIRRLERTRYGHLTRSRDERIAVGRRSPAASSLHHGGGLCHRVQVRRREAFPCLVGPSAQRSLRSGRVERVSQEAGGED